MFASIINTRNWVALFVLVLFAGSVQAYCRDYIEDASQQFSYTYICKNSLKAPPYLIVRQYIDDVEFEMFELAYRDLRLLCSRVVLDNGKKYGDCSQYGVRGLKQRYDNGAYTIDTGKLDQTELAGLYKKESLYRYPEFAEQATQTGCAIVLASNKMIYWRFPVGQPQNLSECLLNFELFATKEKLRF